MPPPSQFVGNTVYQRFDHCSDSVSTKAEPALQTLAFLVPYSLDSPIYKCTCNSIGHIITPLKVTKQVFSMSKLLRAEEQWLVVHHSSSLFCHAR